MKRLFWGIGLLALVLAAPIPTQAGVRIPLPPPIFFVAPPALVVLPETYVYVAPDVDVDIFFYDGWWWRPWEGRWYRSASYDSGWAYYRREPGFYRAVPSGWRNDYRDHRWQGHAWDYRRIPHDQVQQNWRGWKKDRYWEKQQTWGVRGLQPRTQSPRPSREARQPRQSRPSIREDRRGQSPQYRAGPGARENAPGRATRPKRRDEGRQPREEQPQGGHDRGEGPGRR